MNREWKVQDLLDWTRDYFKNHEIEEPRLEAEVLLAFALQVDRVSLYVQYDHPVNADERELFRDLVKRRVRGEPVAYITGQREFMSLKFEVGPQVLIPRPETETLVEETLRLLEDITHEVPVADVGTGCGAIAASLAHYCPRARVWAVDIDPAALELARSNLVRLGVEDRVTLLQGDLLEPLGGIPLQVVVANLPYIPTGDMPKLSKDIRNFEPRLALDGGERGLDLYRRLVEQAAGCLVDQGHLLMEIMDDEQARGLMDLIGTGWSEIRILPDLGGRARVITAKKGALPS